MLRRRKPLWLKLIIAVISTTVVLAISLEVVWALAFGYGKPTVDVGLMTIRRSGTMPQYANSPYWSVEFVDAFSNVIWHRVKVIYEDGSEDRFKDKNGVDATNDIVTVGYTIINNQRLTTDQPERWINTVWMYGSSTLWGAYVADGWTISSYLQRELNSRGIPYRVVNMGQPGINASLEYYWLTQSDVRSGDIVIFVDGAVDLQNSLTSARKEWVDSTFSCQASKHINLVILNLLCQSNTSYEIPSSIIERWTNRDFNRYWEALKSAKEYANQHGATFYHFMQAFPTPRFDLYLQLAQGDPILHVNSEDYFDELHYDDDGHASIAKQIADYMVVEF